MDDSTVTVTFAMSENRTLSATRYRPYTDQTRELIFLLVVGPAEAASSEYDIPVLNQAVTALDGFRRRCSFLSEFRATA
jgi:hypothetical protein